MRKVSKKQAKRLREYKKVRDQYITEHPVCEVDGCYQYATEIHHKKGRVGDLLTDPEFFLAVCHEHHRYIEDHPDWAKKYGYSLSRLS